MGRNRQEESKVPNNLTYVLKTRRGKSRAWKVIAQGRGQEGYDRLSRMASTLFASDPMYKTIKEVRIDTL